MARFCFAVQKWHSDGQCAISSWQTYCWPDHRSTEIELIFRKVELSLGFTATLKNQGPWNRRPALPCSSTWLAWSSQGPGRLETACFPLPLDPWSNPYSTFPAPMVFWAGNHRLGDDHGQSWVTDCTVSCLVFHTSFVRLSNHCPRCCWTYLPLAPQVRIRLCPSRENSAPLSWGQSPTLKE